MKTQFSFLRSLFLGLSLLATGAPYQKIQASICGEPVVQVGWFIANQGRSQHIDIKGQADDRYRVTKSTDHNLLVGAGYYFRALDRQEKYLSYGFNAFYFAPTEVKGNVRHQELHKTLSYEYSITNYPVYFASKYFFQCYDCCSLSLDFGIGPNFIKTAKYKEKNHQGDVVFSSELFCGKTKVAFSAMGGLGMKFSSFYGLNFGLDYRFFYLGEGEFKKNNSHLKDSLSTGNSYANALYFTISL